MILYQKTIQRGISDEDKPVVVPPILDELVEDEDEGDIYPGESMASR